MQRFPAWLLIVAAMAAVGPVSIDMYLPGFPAIERELGEGGVEITMAAYILGLALSQLFYGPISDRFGRKAPLYVGFALYSAGSLGCALAGDMATLSAMRVLQAIGGSSGFVIGRAIVRDRCEPHEAARAFSTLMTIFALGPVLAPAIGGVIVTFLSWRATFIFQAIFGLVLIVTIHRVLGESRDPAQQAPLSLRGVMRSYARVGSDRVLVGYSLVAGFGMGGMFAYVTGAPLVLTERYGLSAQQFGYLIGLNGLAFMAASQLNIRALRTQTPAQTLARYIPVPTLVALALLALVSLWHMPLWAVVALQLLFFVGVGRVNPNVAALALAPHGRDAGSASALMGSVQSVLSMASGAAVAVLSDGTVATLVAIMCACALGSLLSYFWASASR